MLSNIGAKVLIQALLNKTISRLLEYVNIPPTFVHGDVMGSSGYSTFMHKPAAEVPEEKISDDDDEFKEDITEN